MNVKSKSNLRLFYGKKGLCFVSLLFMIALAFSVLLSTFNNDYETSFFVSGASSTLVSTEVELVRAVNNAVGPVVIALDNDIVITGSSLIIPANKDVTLTSNRASGFYKLIGTVSVHNNGVLRLDSITVTHTDEAWGCGVIVYSGGQLLMSDGEITGNYGMLGGGGGVSVFGSFIMSGGSITGNTAQYGGGGVSVKCGGSFSMTGGTISGNKALYVDDYGANVYGSGGGVSVFGSFIMSGGSITGNTASYGGGVYVTSEGSFTITGGSITGNYVLVDDNNYGGLGGGAFFYSSTNVNRAGGTISDNTGGDVYTYGDNSGSSSDGHDNSPSNDPNAGLSGDRRDGFSLADIVVICIGVIIIAIGIVLVVMFSSLQKRVTKIEEKINRNIEG